MSVVQHKSITGTTQDVSLTLNSPVTEGNLLVAVIGHLGSNAVYQLYDGASPSSLGYTQIGEVFTTPDELEAYFALAQSTETYTLEVNFASNDGSAKHVHLYEINGYDTPDGYNTPASTFNANIQNVTNSPSVTTAHTTSFAPEFVLAAFLDITHSEEPFTAGSGYTAGETTNPNGSFSMFTEFKEIAAIGQPSASASIPNTDVVISLIMTFYSSANPGGGSGGSGGGTATNYLGSVTEVESIPSGGANIFIGTVSVLTAAPSGVANPYLGQIRVVSAPAGVPNPSLGQVVVIGSAPANDENPWLGNAATS